MLIDFSKEEVEFLIQCCIFGHNLNQRNSDVCHSKMMCALTDLRDGIVPEKVEWHIGDLYEDCGLHPCMVTEIEYGDYGEENSVQTGLGGISLIDGSAPRSCSILHCAPRKIDAMEAIYIKHNWAEIQKNINDKMKDYWEMTNEVGEEDE